MHVSRTACLETSLGDCTSLYGSPRAMAFHVIVIRWIREDPLPNQGLEFVGESTFILEKPHEEMHDAPYPDSWRGSHQHRPAEPEEHWSRLLQ